MVWPSGMDGCPRSGSGGGSAVYPHNAASPFLCIPAINPPVPVTRQIPCPVCPDENGSGMEPQVTHGH